MMAEPQEAADPWAEFPIASEGAQARGDTEDFSEFPLADPGGGARVKAFGQMATGTALETGGLVSGMVMGGSIGALAGPVGMGVGAAVGAAAGFMGGRGARGILSDTTDLTVRSLEDLPEGVRGFGAAGEVVGGGLPIVGTPLAAARAGARLPPSTIGNFVNKIVDAAAHTPGAFMVAELAALQGAAVAGGAAETYRPGDVLTRIGAEIAGGFFNPGRLIGSAFGGARDAVSRVWASMSAAGRETKAAKVLGELLQEAGEDPVILAQLLRQADLPGVELSAAQKSGSPALAALEAKLISDSGKFGAEMAERTQGSLDSIRGMIASLRGTGDPQAFHAAAELRSHYFRTLLAGRVKSAETEALEAARAISRDTPGARVDISTQARTALDSALSDARALERELWGRVPRDVEANAGGLLNRYEAIRADLLPEERLPEIVEGFAARMTEQQGVTTSGELLRIRSRALALAREADGTGKVSEARIYGQLAAAALDDLSAIGARGGGAVDEARQFSRELNDTFTRTFAGRAQQSASTGADRIPPELMLRRAIAGGPEARQIQMEDLDEATRFLTAKGIDSPEAVQNAGTMLDAQERILRLSAAEAVDPNTGRVSATRLGRFVRDNEGLLDRFPEAKEAMQQAVKTELRRKDVERMATGATRAIDQQAAFSKIAKIENPVDAVRSALAGPNPVSDMERFAKVANRGGPEAVEGFKAAVWDNALRQAGDDPANIRAALFDPIRPGAPSVTDMMKRSGVMSDADVTSAERFIDEMDRIVKAVKTGGEMFDTLAQNPDGLFDLVTRIVGARIGAAGAAGAAAGSPLIAAGAGSRFLRSLMKRVPQAQVRTVLIEAARDPSFMAMLVEKAPTEQAAFRLSRQIHAYLLQAGIQLAEPEGDE